MGEKAGRARSFAAAQDDSRIGRVGSEGFQWPDEPILRRVMSDEKKSPWGKDGTAAIADGLPPRVTHFPMSVIDSAG